MALTIDEGLQLQEALIAEYRKPEFQKCLHEAYARCGGDEVQFGTARMELCAPLQHPVIAKFGFEASRQGVHQSNLAFRTEEFQMCLKVKEQFDLLIWLVSPGQQAAGHRPIGTLESFRGHTQQPVNSTLIGGSRFDRSFHAMPAVALSSQERFPTSASETRNGLATTGEKRTVSTATIWQVVGGAETGGIMVREGCALDSSQYQHRLETGAQIAELARRGNRLNYKLVAGNGPHHGWVSISLKDKTLVTKI